MASGLAVVAPDRGATLELASRESAQLFKGGDLDALVDALDGLVRDAPRRADLRAAGHRVAQSRSRDAIWDGLLREYLEVAAAPGSTGRVSLREAKRVM